MIRTPNQIRDDLAERIGPLTAEKVQQIRSLAHQLTEACRDDPETYLRCPRCYGYHSVHGNFENLCEDCRKTILTHFPEHESVPFIKAAMAKWHRTENLGGMDG